MYDVEKCSTILENASGFARPDAYIYIYIYIYGPITKWQHWGVFIL